jgi:hypothetical protein
VWLSGFTSLLRDKLHVYHFTTRVTDFFCSSTHGAIGALCQRRRRHALDGGWCFRISRQGTRFRPDGRRRLLVSSFGERLGLRYAPAFGGTKIERSRI